MTFGVLTTNSVEEALERAGEGRRTRDGKRPPAAVEMADVVAQLDAAERTARSRVTGRDRVKKDPRHRAREAALQILYQWDVGRVDVERAAETFFGLQWPDAEPPPEALRGLRRTWRATRSAGSTTIDALIADTAERWRPERMAVLDRLILRMAVCELLRDRATPPAVVINEALELARTFSTEDVGEVHQRDARRRSGRSIERSQQLDEHQR